MQVESLANNDGALKFSLELPPLQCLIIDDEPDFYESLHDWFRSRGVECSTFDSLSTGSGDLEEHWFDIAIVDNVFGATRKPRGSDYLLREARKGASLAGVTVILTGYPLDLIRGHIELQSAGVHFIEKGSEMLPNLDRLISLARNARASAFHEAIDKIIEGTKNLGQPRRVGEVLLGARLALTTADLVRAYFMDWPNQGQEQIAFDGRSLSPIMISKEIEKGSNTGLEIVRAFLEESMTTDG